MRNYRSLMVTLLLTAVLSFPGAAFSNPNKFVIASFIPPQAPHNQVIGEWAKELEKISKGTIETQLNTGSVMGKPGEHFDLAVNGIADAAWLGMVFTPGRFPMAEVVEFPIGGQGWTDEIAAKALLKLFDRGYLDRDFKDVHVAFFGSAGPFHLQMAKKPISVFSDIKGQKIRGAGKTHTQMVESLGGVSVGVSGGEIFIALQKGIVDGSFMPYAATYDWKCAEIVKHVTEIGVGTNGFVLVINKESYKKLPKDVQEWIVNNRENYTRKAGLELDKVEKLGKQDILKAGGKIYQFSDADIEKVTTALAPVWVKWIEEGEAKGLPRKKMLKELYDILLDSGINTPMRGYAP